MRKRVKAEVFAELSDPVLFPRLSDAEMEQLAERGERRTFETDELLFEQGIRDAPFFVIEHGTVDIIDRRLQEDVWFARMDGGTFIGDVSMFTGEPTIAPGVAIEPTSVIAFARSRSATCSSGTCCRCAGTTSTPTPRAPRCWRRLPFRARRRPS